MSRLSASLPQDVANSAFRRSKSIRLLPLRWKVRREMLAEYAKQHREVADAFAKRCTDYKAIAGSPTGPAMFLNAPVSEAIRRRLWPDLSSYANRVDAQQDLRAWKCYRNIVAAVILEVTCADICGKCGGAGREGIACERCGTLGFIAATDHERAAVIGVSPLSYGASWRKVYEWVYPRCVAAYAECREHWDSSLARV